jgi:hypothetical protein
MVRGLWLCSVLLLVSQGVAAAAPATSFDVSAHNVVYNTTAMGYNQKSHGPVSGVPSPWLAEPWAVVEP